MIRHAIDRFIGSWIAASGHRLYIRKLRRDRASVDFLDSTGLPVERPYMKGAPSLQMFARYDEYYGDFEVDLWKRGKGFSLYLEHQYDYELDQRRSEALVPGISRNEEDTFLDRYYPLFGRLKHFVRATNAEPDSPANGSQPIRSETNRTSSAAGSRR